MDAGPVWVGTSWKMNKTIGEAVAYARRLASIDVPAGVRPFVLPAHTALAAVRAALPADSTVLLGAQNAHWAAEGAATGEVSMRMVRDAGADLVEVGHSERRAEFGETDQSVARKVAAALDHGLTPLVCVGESAADRQAGNAVAFVRRQVQAALSRISPEQASRVLIAYEPVWAIGSSGRAATPDDVAPVLAAIDATVGRRSERGPGALLYGGSVDATNAAALLGVPHVDGLFVGRAAWQVEGLRELLTIAGRHAAT